MGHSQEVLAQAAEPDGGATSDETLLFLPTSVIMEEPSLRSPRKRSRPIGEGKDDDHPSTRRRHSDTVESLQACTSES